MSYEFYNRLTLYKLSKSKKKTSKKTPIPPKRIQNHAGAASDKPCKRGRFDLEQHKTSTKN